MSDLVMEATRDSDMGAAYLQTCEMFGDRRAYRVDAEWITWAESLARVRKIAAVALELSCSAPDGRQPVVALLLPNSATMMEFFFAAGIGRFVVLPVNHRLTPQEISDVLRVSGACLLVTAKGYIDKLDALEWGDLPVRQVLWTDDTQHALPCPSSTLDAGIEGINAAFSLPAPRGDDFLELFATSGTTGRVKLVPHTHDAVLKHAEATIAALELDASVEECWAHVGPMFHVGDIAFVWVGVLLGSRHVFVDNSLQMASISALLVTENVTMTKLAPSLLGLLVESEAVKGLRFPYLRWILTGGAKPDPASYEATKRVFGCDFIQGYGMTEATCHVAFKNESSEPIHAGLKVLPGLEFVVLSADGHPLGTDDIGEIALRGPTVTPGYLVADDATLDRASFTSEGYFRTGDLGRKCSGGRLHVVGRLKEMINVGGENVFCGEVETVVREMSEVRDCAAFAVPDPVLGEVVGIALELTGAQEISQITARLRDHCRTRLAGYKIPRKVLVELTLPRTASGKIQRHLLATKAADQATLPAAVESTAQSIEQVLLGTVRRHLGLGVDAQIGLDSNVLDLGLDSLQVIELLATLEAHQGFALPATLIYDHPTISGLISHLQEMGSTKNEGVRPPRLRSAESATEQIVNPKPAPKSSLSSWFLQGFGLLIKPTIAVVGTLPVVGAAIWSETVLGPLAVLALAPLWVALTIALVLGLHVIAVKLLEPSAQSFALWSLNYCRWVIAHNLLRSLDDVAGLIRGTPMARVFYRLLGARIGAGARIDSLLLTDLRWVSIGDGAVIGRDAVIQPARFVDGLVVREPIQIGNGAGVGPASQVIGETLLHDNAEIRVLGTGSDAHGTDLGDMPPRRQRSGTLLPFVIASYVYVAATCLGLIFFGLVSGNAVPELPRLVMHGLSQGVPLRVAFASAAALVLVVPAASFAATVLIERLALRPLRRFDGCRETCRAVYGALIEVPFFPMWLRLTVMSHVSAWNYRLLGASIGTRPMLAAPYVDSPADLVIHDHAVVAGNVSMFTRDWRCGGGLPIDIGSRSIVANSCVLLGGGKLPDDTLLGDLSSLAEGDGLPAGSIAVGSPPRVIGRSRFHLAEMGAFRYGMLQACLVASQVLVSLLVAVLGIYALLWVTKSAVELGGYGLLTVALPAAFLLRRMVKVLAVVLAKWLVIGRVEAGEHPLMGVMYARWVFLEALIMDAEPAILRLLRGTHYLATLWRSLGAKVGREACFFASSLGCEFDLKSIGSGVVLAPQSMVFAHSVEHHSLLFRSCAVGAGVRVEENAIIEAGADVADGLRVRPNRAVHAARQVAEVSATQRVPDVDVVAMEHLAQQKLAPAIFQYFAGGSETGRALQRNLDSLAEIAICPRRLRDVSNVSLATTLLGRSLSSPILVAPSAMHRLLHPDGELATSRAVAAGNMGMVLSMLSTSPLEQVMKPFAEARGLPLFQLYCLKDRSVVNSLVKRAEACGFQGLVVTVDSPASGKLTVDPRAWMKFSQEMSLPHLPGVEDSALSPLARFESMKDPSLTFTDLVRLQETTRLPIWLKGILSPGDAVMAAALGFRGIILSNHGGRRLDAEVSALEMVSAVRLALDRAGHEVTLLVDGGIRHGNDVFKALALGADAVLVGRAPLWGLAVAGEAGVAQVLKRMNEELVMAMKLAGCSALGELTPDLLYIRPGKFAVSSPELWGSRN